MTADQTALIEWRDDVTPVSIRFDDPYFSIQNGHAETEHVFLAGNGLPERFIDGFHIAELGFGTGLNFLVTLAAWRASGCEGRFNFTSFEAFPMSPNDMKTSLSAFPELGELAKPLIAAWRDSARIIEADDFQLTVVVGDARTTLPAWNALADAWYLDGFSPAKNPELWEETVMAEVGNHTASDGTFATYTAAGHVRRSLDAAGFTVERVQGYGRKRHMSTGILRVK